MERRTREEGARGRGHGLEAWRPMHAWCRGEQRLARGRDGAAEGRGGGGGRCGGGGGGGGRGWVGAGQGRSQGWG